jgi:PKHD-type hydroxylase
MDARKVYDYWHWSNVISEKDRQGMIGNFLQRSLGDEKEELQGHNEQGNMKNAKVKTISLGRLPEINRFLDSAYKTNNEIFGYNLWERNNLDVMLLNRYTKDMNYHWHTDASRDLAHDIKLTFLINLSNNNSYEGGQFQIYNNLTLTCDFNPGDMIMFKSGLHHRVTPITSGERISLTHFMVGPRFI